MNRIIIVSSDDEITREIIQFCGMAEVVRSGNEARRIIKSEAEPEFIIINSPLPDEFGHELAEMAAETIPVILICTEDIAERVSDYGVIAVPKPLNRQILANAIKLTDGSQGMEKESSEILNRIDEMRLINRAKSILMKYLKFTEPQAHKYIEKQSMNNRQTRKETAIRILNTYEK